MKLNQITKEAIANYCETVVPALPFPILKGNKHDPRLPLRNAVGPNNVAWLVSLLPPDYVADVCIRRGGGYSSYVPHTTARILGDINTIVDRLN